MLPFFRKKRHLTPEEDQRIIAAIRKAEERTSGEVRVFVESKNPMVDPVDRATEIFHLLKMHETHHRNGVLIYVAVKHRELAIYGDEGIHQMVGSDFWHREVQTMLGHFKKNEMVDGVIHCIRDIGEVLAEKFPFIPGEDKNELPDDIIFGH